MRKIIFTFGFLLSFAFSLFSQITLTVGDMPTSGRINLMIHDTLSSPNIGTAGSNSQTWDFTGLTAHYPQVASYSSTTPYHQYAATFPESNIYTYGPSFLYGDLFGGAPVDNASFGYMYLASDSSGLSILGFVSQYGIVHQIQKDKIIELPFTLNDGFNDTSYWEINFDANPLDADTIYRSHLEKYVEVDAFGSLTTDFGTFDVLRIRENIIRVDSIFGTIGGLVVFSMEVLRDTINNFHFWANNVQYPIAIVRTDAQLNVLRTELLNDTMPNYQITGTVFNTDGSSHITAGKAQLIPKNPIDHFFGVHEIVDIDVNGNFQFSNVLEQGHFLVLATPDYSLYPDYLPTYYGDSIYWQDALSLQLQSDAHININLRNNTQWQNAPGNGNSISGTIWSLLSSNKGPANSTPAKDIRLTLLNHPDGEVIRHYETNENGTYLFTDLPALEFTLKVDIPGVHMDSTYLIDLTLGNNENLSGYDFVYDSLYVYIYDATGISIKNESFNVSIFPNPIYDKATLVISNYETDINMYDFEIFDITGRPVKQLSGTTNKIFSFDRNNLASGIYFYKLTINKSVHKTGKIIIN